MKINELKAQIETQKEININLYNRIPIATREDPLNEKAEPILQQWREGSKKLKKLLNELYKIEKEEKELLTLNVIVKEVKTFVNSYGEATTREITCNGYKRAESRTQKEIMSFIGSN